MGHFLRALSLLTVLPVRASWEGDPELGKAAGTFPLVGAVIGVAVGLLAWPLALAAHAGSAAVSLLGAALVLVAMEGLAGFLHLDGWADCCDALLAPLPKERRLEIMKDPRLGSFGVAGLVCLLLVKVSAIASILAVAGGPLGLRSLVVAPVLSRFACVVTAAAFPLARSEGMAASLRRGLGTRQVVVATVTAVAAAALLGWRGAFCVVAAIASSLAMGSLAVAKIGGATGDVYGATVELAETLTLVVAAFLRA